MNIEIAKGIVLGPVTVIVEVIAPNGDCYARSSKFVSEQDSLPWAYSVRSKAIATVGNTESTRLGLHGKWTLRIHN